MSEAGKSRNARLNQTFKKAADLMALLRPVADDQPHPGAKAMSAKQQSPIQVDIAKALEILQNSPNLCSEFNKLVGVPALDEALADNERQAAEITRLQSELAEAQATIAKMREALEKIDRIDCKWVAPQYVHSEEIIERGPLNVLVRGTAGKIARAALAPPATEEG